MAKIIVLFLIILVLAIAGLLILKPGLIPNLSPNQITQNKLVQPIKSFTKELDVPLDQKNNSNQLGYAQLIRSGTTVSVKISLKGQKTKDLQPVNIYTGSCSSLGSKKYALTNISNGLSQTDLKVNGDQLITQLPLAIAVNKSVTDNTTVACGEIKL